MLNLELLAEQGHCIGNFASFVQTAEASALHLISSVLCESCIPGKTVSAEDLIENMRHFADEYETASTPNDSEKVRATLKDAIAFCRNKPQSPFAGDTEQEIAGHILTAREIYRLRPLCVTGAFPGATDKLQEMAGWKDKSAAEESNA